MIGGLLLGFVRIAVALLRARSVPRWAPALIVVFVALEGAFLLTGNSAVETIGFAALAAGLGTVGVRLARTKLSFGQTTAMSSAAQKR